MSALRRFRAFSAYHLLGLFIGPRGTWRYALNLALAPYAAEYAHPLPPEPSQ